MADYINKCILKGRLGKDPEMRYLPSGDAVVNFSIATKSGQHVEWHSIVAYKHLAERAKSDLGIGDLVYIEGESKTREMQSADDKLNNRKARKIREVIADTLHLVEKRNGPIASHDEQIESSITEKEETEIQQPVGGIPAYI